MSKEQCALFDMHVGHDNVDDCIAYAEWDNAPEDNTETK